jgi:hypothetical protein
MVQTMQLLLYVLDIPQRQDETDSSQATKGGSSAEAMTS